MFQQSAAELWSFVVNPRYLQLWLSCVQAVVKLLAACLSMVFPRAVHGLSMAAGGFSMKSTIRKAFRPQNCHFAVPDVPSVGRKVSAVQCCSAGGVQRESRRKLQH